MRLFACCAAIAVPFALAQPSQAQVSYAVAGARHSAPAVSARTAGLRLLTWPGKVLHPSDQATSSAAALTAVPPPAESAPPRSASPLPVSIYSPPPAPAPRATAPAAAQAPVRALAQASPAAGAPATARFYSVHRPYGDAPDPISLSPQFMSDANPDLAAPPPPVPRPVTTANGQVVRALPTDQGAAAPSNSP